MIFRKILYRNFKTLNLKLISLIFLVKLLFCTTVDKPKFEKKSLEKVCFPIFNGNLLFTGETLRSLYISDNDFETFPSDIQKLKELQVVSFLLLTYKIFFKFDRNIVTYNYQYQSNSN